MTPPHPAGPGRGSDGAAPEPELPELRELRAGEPEAVDRWFRREHPAVFRLCLGFLADGGEADDAAQDAMLLLLDRLPTFDPTRAWRPWRDTVVLNLCRDRLRRRAGRTRHEERAAAGEESHVLPDPADTASSKEVGRILERSLALLSEREREAFVLRDLEGLSTREAADALGIGESSVRSLLTLARRRLRGALARRLPGLVPDGTSGIGGSGGSA